MSAVILTRDQRLKASAVAIHLGNTIREARRAAGLSAHDLAVATDSHATTVTRIERGESENVKLGNLLKLLDYLGLSLAVCRGASTEGSACG